MTEEPTVLMSILDILIKIVVYVGVMGGFIFFLCLINLSINFLKNIPLGKPVIKMYKKKIL